MPLHRSNHTLSRAIWTIRNGMQVARMAAKGVKAFKKYRQSRSVTKRPPSAVTKVRSKLEMANPLYKNRDKLYRKDTPAGQKRRAVFAAQLKKRSRPVRSKTGNFAANKLPRKPYSGKIAIAKGMSGGQIKRNIVRHEIKRNSAELVKKHHGNRIAAAREIKFLRNNTRTPDYSKWTGHTMTKVQFKPTGSNRYVKAASRILSR